MALPDTVTTGAGLWRGFNPPHKSSGGNYYCIASHTSSTTDLSAKKNAIPGTNTWDSQDVTNRPTGLNMGANLSVASISDGTVIHIATVDETTLSVQYHRFDMSSDTWDITNNTVADLSGMDAPNTAVLRCGIAIRSGVTGDELVIAACGLDDTIMGTDWQRVDLWHGPDSGTPSWTGPVALDDTGAEFQYIIPQLVLGTNDGVHVSWARSTNTTIVGYGACRVATFDSGNTLSTVIQDASLNNTTDIHPISNMISWDDSGTQRVAIVVPTPATTANLNYGRGVEDINDDISAWSDTPFYTSGGGDGIAGLNGENKPVSLVVDGTDVYILFGGDITDGTSVDLWYDHTSDNGANWDGATEELDAVTINFISADILDTGKIAYLYDDGGTTKYNELTITAAVGAILYKPQPMRIHVAR